MSTEKSTEELDFLQMCQEMKAAATNKYKVLVIDQRETTRFPRTMMCAAQDVSELISILELSPMEVAYIASLKESETSIYGPAWTSSATVQPRVLDQSCGWFSEDIHNIYKPEKYCSNDSIHRQSDILGSHIPWLYRGMDEPFGILVWRTDHQSQKQKVRLIQLAVPDSPYQSWGVPLLFISGKEDETDFQNVAARVFPGYQFEYTTGSGRKTVLMNTNPARWQPEVHESLAAIPSEAFEKREEAFFFGLIRPIAEHYKETHQFDEVENDLTTFETFGSIRRKSLYFNTKCYLYFLAQHRGVRVLPEARKFYGFSSQRYRYLTNALRRSIVVEKDVVVLLPTQATMMLRPSQRTVLDRMLEWETNDKSIENRVFSKICDIGSRELMFSPMCGFAEREDPTKDNMGGLLVAPVGWGKTVVALALIETTQHPGDEKTLVICPEAVLSQWKNMCTTMSSLQPYVYTRYTSEIPEEAQVVLVSFEDSQYVLELPIRYSNYQEGRLRTLKNTVWKRVIYDEIHASKMYYYRWLRTKTRWGMTATPLLAKGLSLYHNYILGNIIECDAEVRHQEGTSAVGPFADVERVFLERCALYIEENDDITPVTVTETTMGIDFPERVRQRFHNVQNAIAEAGIPLDGVFARRRLRRVAAGYLRNRSRIPDGPSTSAVPPSVLYESDDCPICLDPVTVATTISCGHVFCKACIVAALDVKQCCPMCRKRARHVTDVTQYILEKEKPTQEPAEDPNNEDPNEEEAFNGAFDDFRAARACEVLQSIEGKAVVFSAYDCILSSLCERLGDAGISYVRLAAKASVETQSESLSTFSNDPGCKVVVLNLKWGNAGLNLTAANTVLFIEEPGVPEQRQQAIGRVNRRGQTGDVAVLTLQNEALGY